jgi:hypothetical protein
MELSIAIDNRRPPSMSIDSFDGYRRPSTVVDGYRRPPPKKVCAWSDQSILPAGARQGVPLPCHYRHGYAEVILPELTGHAMLVFED